MIFFLHSLALFMQPTFPYAALTAFLSYPDAFKELFKCISKYLFLVHFWNYPLLFLYLYVKMYPFVPVENVMLICWCVHQSVSSSNVSTVGLIAT